MNAQRNAAQAPFILDHVSWPATSAGKRQVFVVQQLSSLIDDSKDGCARIVAGVACVSEQE